MQRGKRLYLDKVGEGGRYAMINIEYLRIFLELGLTNLQMLIMFDIIFEYESHTQNDVSRSYGDFAELYSYTRTRIKQAIDPLVRRRLLISNKTERKGRAKTRYRPNVPKLQQLLTDYIIEQNRA
jgi:hypothetical protein